MKKAQSDWILTAEQKPNDGAWVLMYLNLYMGVDKYRAGIYFEHGSDWLSAANANEVFRGGSATLKDEDVLFWMPLPDPP